MNQPTTQNWDLTEEEMVLSAQLGAEVEPENSTQTMATEAQPESLGKTEVIMLTGVLMSGFEKASQIALKNPQLRVPPEASELIAPKVGAVLDKHGATTPEFLAKWREELDLAMSFGGLLYGMYRQHIVFKQQEAAFVAEQAMREAENVKEAA